jgi:hypothetical protein
MTPAARLLAAADLLDKRAGEATEGPWTVERWEDFLGEQVTWSLPGIERWRGLKNDVQLGEDEATARYIATMHPEVGKALATALRVEGGTVAGWAPEPAESHAALLLPIADLLLAGAS